MDMLGRKLIIIYNKYIMTIFGLIFLLIGGIGGFFSKNWQLAMGSVAYAIPFVVCGYVSCNYIESDRQKHKISALVANIITTGLTAFFMYITVIVTYRFSQDKVQLLKQGLIVSDQGNIFTLTIIWVAAFFVFLNLIYMVVKSHYIVMSLSIILIFFHLATFSVAVMYPGYRHASSTASAERYRAERDYDRALPHVQAIVRQYPGAWMQVKNLGDCYLFKKKPDPKTALQYYQLVQQSADYQSYINNPQVNADEKQLWVLDEEIGICYAEMGDRPNAQAYFAKVLETAPDNPAVNYYLGVDYFEKGDYAKAAKCFQYAATFDQVKPPETNDTETPRQGTKWGDLWDKRAAPYRQKIAQLTLGKAPEAPGNPQGGGKG